MKQKDESIGKLQQDTANLQQQLKDKLDVLQQREVTVASLGQDVRKLKADLKSARGKLGDAERNGEDLSSRLVQSQQEVSNGGLFWAISLFITHIK